MGASRVDGRSGRVGVVGVVSGVESKTVAIVGPDGV
jgi:hypothetical protein